MCAHLAVFYMYKKIIYTFKNMAWEHILYTKYIWNSLVIRLSRQNFVSFARYFIPFPLEINRLDASSNYKAY